MTQSKDARSGCGLIALGLTGFLVWGLVLSAILLPERPDSVRLLSPDKALVFEKVGPDFKVSEWVDRYLTYSEKDSLSAALEENDSLLVHVYGVDIYTTSMEFIRYSYAKAKTDKIWDEYSERHDMMVPVCWVLVFIPIPAVLLFLRFKDKKKSRPEQPKYI